jgi:hypothetical protein
VGAESTPARTSTWSARSPPGTWIWYRGRALEGVLRVRPDLGLDAERSQEAERAAGRRRLGDVEVDGELAVAEQVEAARRVEEPESSARRSQSRCGSIAASSRGPRQRAAPSSSSIRRLYSTPSEP